MFIFITHIAPAQSIMPWPSKAWRCPPIVKSPHLKAARKSGLHPSNLQKKSNKNNCPTKYLSEQQSPYDDRHYKIYDLLDGN